MAVGFEMERTGERFMVLFVAGLAHGWCFE